MGRENLYSTENRLSKNEMWLRQIITIICVTYVKEFFRFEFQLKAVADKISNFNEIALYFIYSKKIVIF